MAYSREEVQALVEGYSELRYKKEKLWILVRMADLDTALWHMPPRQYHAVLLCGLLGLPSRAAGDLLGVSLHTVLRWYHNGLEWITEYLNGGESP